MHDLVKEYLNNFFYNSREVKSFVHDLERDLSKGSVTPFKAANLILRKFFKK
jgi:hypothetical protein